VTLVICRFHRENATLTVIAPYCVRETILILRGDEEKLMRKFLGIAVLLVGLTAFAAAQNTPKAEVFGGYSFVHSSVVGTGFNYNGGIGSITGNVNDWFGIEAEFAGYHTGSNGVSGSLMTYSAGPKLAYRKNDHMTPYVHVLFGGAHSSASFA